MPSSKIVPNLILGGGLAGLSASYHLGHGDCLVLESKPSLFGLLATRSRNGFTWDNGPHVSFTKHNYVRELFAESTEGHFHEIPVNVGNYFHGAWVRHPAQVNLAQVPEPLRAACLVGLVEAAIPPAHNPDAAFPPTPANYREWLELSLGKTFTEHFSAPYTRKYWTVSPEAMNCEWVGGRVHKPSLEDVRAGATSDRPRNLHYIQKIRYPQHGGYQAFAEILAKGVNVRLNTAATSINLERKEVCTSTGETFRYQRLISTIPLPNFISICAQSTPAMREAVKGLLCTSVYLVDVELPAPASRPEHWLYVYDENFLSTRIHFTEKLSDANVPGARGGVQVEIYHSPRRPLPVAEEEIIPRILGELEQMGILRVSEISNAATHLTHIPYANIAFLSDTPARLETLWGELEPYGLSRAADDLRPMTAWPDSLAGAAFAHPRATAPSSLSGDSPSLLMAGRFAQWKYFWTDDCVLRGKSIAAEC